MIEEGSGNNGREKLKDRIRKKLFHIYFEAMKERKMSIAWGIFLLIISFLQLTSYIYSPPFRTNNQTTEYISNILQILRIYPLIHTPTQYLIFLYLTYIFLLIYISQIILLLYISHTGKLYLQIPIILIKYISNIFPWVGLIPVLEILFGVWICEGNIHPKLGDLECWGLPHIGYISLFFMFFLLLIVVQMLVITMYNESRQFSADSFARLDANNEIYFLIYRVIVVGFANILCEFTDYKWILMAIYIFGSIYFCRVYYFNLIYYSSYVSIAYGSCVFIYFWISVNLLCSQIFEYELEWSNIGILVGAILIIAIVTKLRSKILFNKLYLLVWDKIKSEEELHLYLQYLSDLVVGRENLSNYKKMELLGFMTNHSNDCLNPFCPMNTTTRDLYLPATNAYCYANEEKVTHPVAYMHLISSITNYYTSQYNYSSSLYINYSNHLFYQMKNIHLALVQLNNAELRNPSLQQSFSIYRNRRFIENFLKNRCNERSTGGKKGIETLDVTLVIKFEKLFTQLQGQIANTVDKHVEFWSQLDSLLPDLNILHKRGLEIIIQRKQTENIWYKLMEINKNYPKALHMYGWYISEIHNNNLEGEKLQNTARELNLACEISTNDQHINDFDLMFADDTAIVIINGNEQTQGKIVKTNSGITKLFGYNSTELCGHDIKILMPPLIANQHSLVLDNYFHSGKENAINNETSSFALHRSSYVFPVSIICKQVPSLSEDIQYIGLIRKILREYDFIITDKYGRIDSLTAGITLELNVSPSLVKENDVYIQYICPELCEMTFPEDCPPATKFESFLGNQTLNFIIPKNFIYFIQNTTSSIDEGNNIIREELDKSLKEEGTFGSEYISKKMYSIESTYSEENIISQNVVQSVEHLQYIPAYQILCKICANLQGGVQQSEINRYMNLKGDNNLLRDKLNYKENEANLSVQSEIYIYNSYNKVIQMKVFKIVLKKKKITVGNTSDNPDLLIRRLSGLGRRLRMKAEIVKMAQDSENLSNEAELTSSPNTPDGVLFEPKTPNIEQLRSSLVRPQSFSPVPRNTRTRVSYFSLFAPEVHQKILTIHNKSKKGTHDQKDKTKEINSSKSEDIQEKVVGGNIFQFFHRRVNERISGEIKGQNTIKMNLVDNMPDIGNISSSGPSSSPINNSPRECSSINKKNFIEHDIFADESGQTEQNEAKTQEDHRHGYPDTEFNSNKMREDAVLNNLKKTIQRGKLSNKSKGVSDISSSVDSSTNMGIAKHLRTIRGLMSMNYTPRSIRNLKWASRLVLIILIVITIVGVIINISLLRAFKEEIKSIHDSHMRLTNNIYIGSYTRSLILLNPNSLLLRNKEPPMDDAKRMKIYRSNGFNIHEVSYYDYTNNKIKKFAKELRKVQNFLYKRSFSGERESKINPKRVEIVYNNPSGLSNKFSVDMTSAIMALVTHAYKTTNIELRDISMNETSVAFVVVNSFNNIIQNIFHSTKTIVEEIESNTDKSKQKLLYLTITASLSLILSLLIIIPVTRKTILAKEKLLSLFTEIPIKNIEEQLERCRNFYAILHHEENHTEEDALKMVSDGDSLGLESESKRDLQITENIGDGVHDGLLGVANVHTYKRTRKYRPYATNSIFFALKFGSFLAILEAYYLVVYFVPVKFMSDNINIVQELAMLTSRSFSNSYIYAMGMELLANEYSIIPTYIMHVPSEEYFMPYTKDIDHDQEKFLSVHSQNIHINSHSYNIYFDSIVYDDICEELYPPNKESESNSESESCEQFMGGLLTKGLNSANLAFWANMRTIAYQHTLEAYNNISLDMINSDSLIMNEILCVKYLDYSYQSLINKLDETIKEKVSFQANGLLIAFILYIIFLLFLHLVIWTRFVHNMKNSLWITHCMLMIIPPEVIFIVPKIRDYIITTSKNIMEASNSKY